MSDEPELPPESQDALPGNDERRFQDDIEARRRDEEEARLRERADIYGSEHGVTASFVEGDGVRDVMFGVKLIRWRRIAS